MTRKIAPFGIFVMKNDISEMPAIACTVRPSVSSLFPLSHPPSLQDGLRDSARQQHTSEYRFQGQGLGAGCWVLRVGGWGLRVQG
eukprot:3933828-Rhodomonas_salina.7